jgi:hypothetical protein
VSDRDRRAEKDRMRKAVQNGKRRSVDVVQNLDEERFAWRVDWMARPVYGHSWLNKDSG